ncbi:MAG: hypothetical protein DME57_05070 [Verrucomicrobia bacterium]|nr:MAG: hypothetical protein DME57_05070 [Verrucomicrobiota bacterium]
MRKLANLIENELKKQEICAVYNSELTRVWPKTISPTKRKEAILRFAKAHRLAVTLYDVGLCAVFEKPDQSSQHRVVLPPEPARQTPRPRKKKKRD